MYQILIGADEVQREDDGTAWTWKGGSVLVELNGKEFEQWIKDNTSKLDATCVAFTGSASQISLANAILGHYLKEAELI